MSDSEEYNKIDEIKNIELDEFLNNEETASILYTNCFNNFEEIMLHKIEKFYYNVLNDCENEFLNIFQKDKFNNKMNNASYELFLIVYKCISKKYDISFFHENPELASCLFKEKEKVIEIKGKKIIKKNDSKIFDWNQKTYK
jgi:hypothetical protein